MNHRVYIVPEKRSELMAAGRSATFNTDTRFTGGSPVTGYSERDEVVDPEDSLGTLQATARLNAGYVNE